MKALELANSIENSLKYQMEYGRRISDLERDVPIAAAELRRLAEVNAELLEAMRLFLDATEGTACVEAADAFGNNAWPKLAEAGNAARDAIAKAKEQQ